MTFLDEISKIPAERIAIISPSRKVSFCELQEVHKSGAKSVLMCTDDAIEAAKILAATDGTAQKIAVVSPHFSHGNCSKILDQYLDECLARGESVGALVAALTTWSSHNNDRFYVRNSHNVDNVAESLSKREDTVAKVLDSEMFAKVSA